MSRFADPFAVAVFSWDGPCQCPGSPHEKDTATVRTSLGASALGRIGQAEQDRGPVRDPLMTYRQLVLESVVGWNLLWPDPSGQSRDPVPVPVSAFTIGEMGSDTIMPLAEFINGLSGDAPPNASSAPSPESAPESASPTPTKTQKPTT